jgi:hypothetical protein
MTHDELQRLHQALVDAMHRTRGNNFGRPVTVSEIYQELVPYRAARGLIGFEMNADYEHALLRLLAGESDLAQIEPAEVREQLRLELDSPNPNVSLFRKFANCDVFVAPRAGVFEPRAPSPEPAEAEAAEAESAPTSRDAPARAASGTEHCPHCGRALPVGHAFRFCPHCGRNIGQKQCSNCGETLDTEWRFCAFCGTSVTARS